MRNTLKNLLAIITAAALGSACFVAMPLTIAAEGMQESEVSLPTGIVCSSKVLDIQAGGSAEVSVAFADGSDYAGYLPKLESDNEAVAIAVNSDVPDSFTVVGFSEGTARIIVTDLGTGSTDIVTVNVTGEAESAFGKGIDITLDALPDKLVYNIGEELDLAGGLFSAAYNESAYSDAFLTEGADMAGSYWVHTGAFDSTTPGIYPINVLYKSYLGYWGAATFEVAVTSGVQGDTDLDGEVTINDAAEVLACYAENSAGARRAVAGGLGTALCDVDGNGIAEIKDAAYILEFYARNGAGLPCTWDDILSE